MLHAAPASYGGRGAKWSQEVAALLERFRCGPPCSTTAAERARSARRSERAPGLGVELREYDPAIPGKDEPPQESGRSGCLHRRAGACLRSRENPSTSSAAPAGADAARALRGHCAGADRAPAPERPAGAHPTALGRVAALSVPRRRTSSSVESSKAEARRRRTSNSRRCLSNDDHALRLRGALPGHSLPAQGNVLLGSLSLSPVLRSAVCSAHHRIRSQERHVDRAALSRGGRESWIPLTRPLLPPEAKPEGV